MTYFESIIRIDPRVPQFMKDKIDGMKFIPFFKRLTEVRRVKRGKKKAATKDYVITGPNDQCLICKSTVGEEVKQALEEYFQRTRFHDVTAKRGGDLYNDTSPDEEESDGKESDNLDDKSSSDEGKSGDNEEVNDIDSSDDLYDTSDAKNLSTGDKAGSKSNSDESSSSNSDSSEDE